MVSSPKDTTRARLLSAAGELLVELGFAATTTRAIAERAGINNALIHYHFGTKAQLLAEAALDLLDDDFDRPMRVLREAASLAAGIEAVVAWLAGLDVTQPSVRILMELTVEGFENPHVRPVVAAALEAARAEMASAVAARRDVDESSAAPLAALLTALFDGIVLHRMVDGDLDVGGWVAGVASLAPGRPRPARIRR